MSAMTRRRGFTLTELMVVVSIIGILTVLGVALLNNAPRPLDAASQVSSKLAETSRKAVNAGSVRGPVAAALGSTARTRARFTIAGNVVTMSIQKLEEDAAPAVTATWVEMSRITLHRTIRLAGYRASADLTGGATAPTVALASGDSLEIRCKPDGTCDGMTIYLTDAKARRKARIVVLPLGGTPMTFDRW
jgi:prepilin-type N-terminal cleavage/methylation domain-containing protein